MTVFSWNLRISRGFFRKNSIFLYSYKNIADHVPELKFDYDGCCFWVEFYQKLKYCNSLLKYKTHENRN